MLHWVVHVIVGDSHLTRLNNFCVHHNGCNGLEKNACRFLVRDSSATSGDSSCKLCSIYRLRRQPTFFFFFSIIFSAHVGCLCAALPTVLSTLPDLTADLRDFDDVVLCVCVHWLDDLGCPAILPTINSTYGADASALVQITEPAQTTCMQCYYLKHLQTPCSTCRQSIRKT